MNTYTYYCEVKDRIREYPQGVYKVVADNDQLFPAANRLITVSDRVWKQGPKGGVKIVRYRSWRLYPTGYITTNKKYMREFAWVKLKAKWK
jgi:hypothetical protein